VAIFYQRSLLIEYFNFLLNGFADMKTREPAIIDPKGKSLCFFYTFIKLTITRYRCRYHQNTSGFAFVIWIDNEGIIV